MSRNSKQLVLKPQDLLVLFKVACNRNQLFTYARLGSELGISASESHSCVKRAEAARLAAHQDGANLSVLRSALIEFVIYGAKYAFPSSMGSVTRGMPTAYAAPPLRELINQPDEIPPVWPDPNGLVRGVAMTPLYHSVPFAAASDANLYECLALFDALRSGAAREREKAEELLRARL
jgi:hypothetical protein